MDLLDEKWQKLTLVEAENREIVIDEGIVQEESKKGECNMVEKLHAEIIINKEVIRARENICSKKVVKTY